MRNGDLGIETKGFGFKRVGFRDWNLGQKSNKSKEATSKKAKKQPAFLFTCRTLISKCDFSQRITASSKHVMKTIFIVSVSTITITSLKI